MSPAVVGIVCFVLIIILVSLGVHIAFALMAVGFAGLVILLGIGPTLSALGITAFEVTGRYDFCVIPLFLLMGTVIAESDIARESYRMARAWVGQLKGGLAIATSGACGIFAACTGSSLAGALAMGKIAYPEMKRYKYDDKLAVGIIAAGGTIGILIPPSMGFILIGILTELSIGKLFMAGIIPGILEVVFYAVTVYILCLGNPQMGPPSAKTTIREKFRSLKLTWPVLALFLLIMGGIYGGVFTPTEAGAVGAFGALVISFARRQLTGRSFAECLLETARTAAMVMAIIIGAFIFNLLLAVTRIPFVASEYISSLGLNRYGILLIVIFVYIIFGMIFDVMSVIVLTIPIMFPVMTSLGFHPLWYGVIMVRMMEIGAVSPPFGMNLFALVSVVKVPLGTMYRGVIPFFIADLLHVALLIVVPSLSTFLPEMMIAPAGG